MSQLSKVLRDTENNGLSFMCPACKVPHGIKYGEGGWSWNGDIDKPTFSPSVLVRNGHYLHPDKKDCWCTYNIDHPENKFKCIICHSFVTNGMIQFLDDCSHELAGQTVPLMEWPVYGE